MDAFFERLIVQAATIDELLSDDFESLTGQKGDADLAARRLAAWCQSSASGDWSLFTRRLDRDRLSIGEVLAKFATVRRRASASAPALDPTTQSGSRRHCKARARTTWLRQPEASRALCVRTSVCAGGRTSRGAALGGYRRPRRQQSERLRSRLPAAFTSQEYLQPCRSGNLRALCQGAEGQRARPMRARRRATAERRTTISSSPT